MASKTQVAKVVNEVVKPYCTSNWCLLKEIMICKHSDSRFIIQLKCIEKFKFILSEKASEDVGWDVAFEKWTDLGYATLFANHYNEEITSEQLFIKITKIKPISDTF